MNSNFTFAFNRRSVVYAAPAPAPVPVPVPAPAPVRASRAPAAPVTSSNRFSVNRLINFKSSGGCRSCN